MVEPARRAAPGRKVFTVLWTAAACLLAGCSLSRVASQEVSEAIEHYQREGRDTASAYAATPGLAKGPLESKPEPPFSQTLRQLIAYALRHNPEVRAAEETASARAERIAQVTALPDPVVSTKTLPEPVRTAEGDNFFILGLRQKLPVPEKLDRAGRVALEEARMALEQLQETRLRVIADVKRAYFQLYVIDRSIDITRDNQDLLQGLIDVARGQVAAGRRSQEDVLRAAVELSNLEAELIELQQRRVSVQAMLNRLLDRSPTVEIPLSPEFQMRSVEVKLKELFDRAAELNPELNRLQRQIERDRQAVKLSQLAYWPDFTVGFEWLLMEPRSAFRPPPNPTTGQRPVVSQMSEQGSDNWAITFGFNLPIWFDKIQSGIREARRKLNASMLKYTSASDLVHFRIVDALSRVRSQQQLAEIFGSTIIPQARQAYEVSRANYAAGAGDFLFVIDNWRKWLVFTIQYHRALGELERSVADLEQAIGLSLSETGASP